MSKFKGNYFAFVLIVVGTLQTTSSQDWVVKDQGCRTPDRGVGDCIAVKKCQPMINVLMSIQRPYSAYVINRLNAYTCGYDEGTLQVCCPSTPINIVEPTKATTPPPRSGPPDVSKHANLKLLPENCGYLDIGDKIRNGINASLNEFPWMALLSYKTSKGPDFRCGGSIISDKYILTAAHCITNLKMPLISVRVGEHNILTSTDCEVQLDGSNKCNGPVQDLSIEQVIVHPRYNTTDFSNDIGLLRVSKINTKVENARPVCLPLESARDQKFNFAVVTGWGYTGEGAKSSSILQRVDLPVVTLENCKKTYESQPNLRITEKQLCAGGRDQKDSCSGDSGGPLQAAAYVNGDTRYVQQGVVSFGPKFCGLDGFPGVYTRVAYYMDWILNNLKA